MLPVEELISIGASGSVPALLTVIAYFLRLLLQEIRDLKIEQTELRKLYLWLKAEQDSLRQSLASPPQQRPKPLRKRMATAKKEV